MLKSSIFCTFLVIPFTLFAGDGNEIPNREPDAVSIPANLSDYYIYDSETNEWVWAEDYKEEQHQENIPTTLPKTLKKQTVGLAKKALAIRETESSAIKRTIKDSDAWVIIARGVDRPQIETKFMTLDKGKYELCRFDRNTTSLDCAVDSND